MKTRQIAVQHEEYLKETLATLRTIGLLLASVDKKGRPNVMTIGWGLIGVIWGRPVFTVLVRPSRYTHRLIEATGDFTVNVPPAGLAETAAYCGRVSGRDHDKFAEKGLTAHWSRRIKSPGIEQCTICYECKVIHQNRVLRNNLDRRVIAAYYPVADLHTIYSGEIVAVRPQRE